MKRKSLEQQNWWNNHSSETLPQRFAEQKEIHREIMVNNKLTEKIIGSAIEVHRSLGPGLLESAYKECLFFELISRNLILEKEKPLPIVYKDVKLDHGYRIDLLVEIKLF